MQLRHPWRQSLKVSVWSLVLTVVRIQQSQARLHGAERYRPCNKNIFSLHLAEVPVCLVLTHLAENIQPYGPVMIYLYGACWTRECDEMGTSVLTPPHRLDNQKTRTICASLWRALKLKIKLGVVIFQFIPAAALDWKTRKINCLLSVRLTKEFQHFILRSEHSAALKAPFSVTRRTLCNIPSRLRF